jgi:5-formyltetrahydrofolate cyclo-ligase
VQNGHVDSAPMTSSRKSALRTSLLAARARRSELDLAAARVWVAAAAVTRAGSLPCVAAYEPLRKEPGSLTLLAGLTSHGCRVLVPITQPDHDLSWSAWPSTEPLGVDAIRSADLVFVPALAVDSAGNRLGRGGGSYDRALARVGAGVPVVALIFDEELLPSVPTDDWDRPVTEALTPLGWHALGRPE